MAKDIYIETLKILDDSNGALSNTELAHQITKMFNSEVIEPLVKMITSAKDGCDCGE